jgi:hypothetical protein
MKFNPAGLDPDKNGKPWSIRRVTTRQWLSFVVGSKYRPRTAGVEELGGWLSRQNDGNSRGCQWSSAQTKKLDAI